jgi:DNA-binding GntR family transcriptional regulator
MLSRGTTGTSKEDQVRGIGDLAASRDRLDRASTAERVAALLRERITEGSFTPGAQLSEDEISGALDISRNTLREAFRMLAHDRLVTHRFNRGVFVNELTHDDVVDIFRLRRLLECGAIRATAGAQPSLIRVAARVAVGRDAAGRDAWVEVGTANLHFHQALAALAGSSRVDDIMATTMAQLRLIFHAMPDARGFHEPYLARNQDILASLEAGDTPDAERLLLDYLVDAERQLLERVPRS